jgi:hypothetical protein
MLVNGHYFWRILWKGRLKELVPKKKMQLDNLNDEDSDTNIQQPASEACRSVTRTLAQIFRQDGGSTTAEFPLQLSRPH